MCWKDLSEPLTNGLVLLMRDWAAEGVCSDQDHSPQEQQGGNEDLNPDVPDTQTHALHEGVLTNLNCMT